MLKIFSLSGDIMNIMDMNVIDSNANAMGISRLTLMENAGRCVAT